jgi:hypothetical protein
MKSNFIFLLLVVLITSCTIQKRVHNRGWHVQWNKIYAPSDRSKTVVLSQLDYSETADPTIKTPDLQTSQEIERRTYESKSVTEIDETSRSGKVPFDSSEPTSSVTSIDQPSDSTDVTSTDMNNAKKAPTHSKAGLVRASIVLIISLIFIALAISSWFALNTAVDLAASIYAVFGLFVFGILGLMLLLIGLIFLGVALNSGN